MAILINANRAELDVEGTPVSMDALERGDRPERPRRDLGIFPGMTDNELIEMARAGDPAAPEILLERHKQLVRIKAGPYFLMGADKEDIIQEGMIGLYKAIRDFRSDRHTSFRAFAELCVTRQIITAVKTATRQKHVPLNTYVSLSKPDMAEEDPDRFLEDLTRGREVSDPVDMVIGFEELEALKDDVASILSRLESEVLHMHMAGKSYQEIAFALNCGVKSVDNALQRVKRKIEIRVRARNF